MSFESLSSLVLLVIVIIGFAVWLPTRTANSMKRVAEHQQDRYSPSLHLVDTQGSAHNGVNHQQPKEVIMPAVEAKSARLTPEHIAQVRSLRRDAIRRRQIIVVSLLVVTVAVLVAAFVLHFSPLFALIPFALLLIVLGLGANAARHARAWEQKVTAYEQVRKDRMKNHPSVTSKQIAADVEESADEETADVVDDAKTEVLEQRQIRRVLREAQAEQTEAIAKRKAASDATSELAAVTPSHALDAFEMAASQDLISFSLGSADDEVTTAEPQSLEIKSLRQVAQAEPVTETTAMRLAEEGRAAAEADALAFHTHEEEAEVEAPDATSDSLGVGLDSILSRRAA